MDIYNQIPIFFFFDVKIASQFSLRQITQWGVLLWAKLIYSMWNRESWNWDPWVRRHRHLNFLILIQSFYFFKVAGVSICAQKSVTPPAFVGDVWSSLPLTEGTQASASPAGAALESCRGHVHPPGPGPLPRPESWSGGQGWSLRLCISHWAPGDADTPVPRATLKTIIYAVIRFSDQLFHWLTVKDVKQ